MNFYNNFLRLCEQAGKKPSVAAEEAGLSRSLVTRWKQGKGFTDASALKLSQYFGCTIDELLNDADAKKDADTKKDTTAEAVMSMRDLMMRMSKDELLTLISDAADILRNK